MEAFGAVRTICRGPKPVRALRAIGLRAGIVSDAPTTEGVMASLAREDLGGRRVGVQLYGEEPNDKLIAFLANAGATVHTVSPYTYQKGPPEPVLELISAMAEGRINVIAFTSSPQVHHLFEVAEARGRAADLRAGLARTRVAAVGPIVAATLGERGCKADIVPERSFFLRPMVNDIATFFANAASGNGAAA
jgi:uroporphyrinogen-III synthase